MNIGWNVRAIASSGLVPPGDRVLMPLPLHHVFPRITATLASLEVGIDGPGSDGVGEILVRGPVVFAGYVGNPEANAQAFTADGFFPDGRSRPHRCRRISLRHRPDEGEDRRFGGRQALP